MMKKLVTKTADASRSEFTESEQMPNVRPAVAADLRLLGVARPGYPVQGDAGL